MATTPGLVLTGKTVPASSLGADGQLYINTVTCALYVRTSGNWTVIGYLSHNPPLATSAHELLQIL